MEKQSKKEAADSERCPPDWQDDANSLVPVEVKAKDSATASLNNLIKWDSYPDVKYGIKFGYKNIGWNGQFYTFPYFLTFLLKRFLQELSDSKQLKPNNQ